MKLSVTQIAVIASIIGGVVLIGALVINRGNDLESKYRELVDVFAIADQLGLDKEKFTADIDSEAIHKKVEDYNNAGQAKFNEERAKGISIGTPAVYINGEYLQMQTLNDFPTTIQAAVDQAEEEGTLPVEIKIYSDFNCPHCAQLSPITRNVKAEQGENITVEYIHTKVINQGSFTTYSYAYEAALLQGKGDEMAKEIFARRHPTVDQNATL
jgi:protein-disulfide isomerase